MPTFKELSGLFRAIGAQDLTKAAALAEKLATEHGAKGRFRVERELLNALTPPKVPNGFSAPNSAWSASSSLVQLKASKPLSDIQLPQSNKQLFEEILREWKAREKLLTLGIPRRWRLLFHGPPGCGKSVSAAALAAELNLPCYLVRFDSLIGSYLGQTALRLRELFRFIETTPCVILFDEVDALAKKRGSPTDVGELDRIVIAFMQELEHANGPGLLIATSNLPRVLDDALWRRFDIQITFPRPSRKELVDFANRSAKKLGVEPSTLLRSAVQKAQSFAEVEQLVIAEARKKALASF